jgi:biotin transport system substrate-specific component
MSSTLLSLRSRVQATIQTFSPGARGFMTASALTLATAVGAWLVVPIPGTPVPLTLQTFFVMTGAGLLGTRLSLGAQSAYLLLGGLGLPWLAGHTLGAPMLLGATGGYLVGFVLASVVIGQLLARSASLGRTLLALLAGEVILFACGATWLGLFLHVSPAQAWTLGVLHFLPGDAVKWLAAAGCIRWFQPSIRKFLNA